MDCKTVFFSLYKKGLKNLSRGHGLGHHYLIRKLLRTVQNFLKPEFAIVLGQKMYLDKYDSLNLAINGVYGQFETDVIVNEIKNDNIVLDIGAHIGYFTLIFAKSVGSNGKVFAFEPEPSNFNLLKKNVEVNQHRNVVLEQKAVSDKNDKCKFFVGQKSSGANRIYEPKKTRTQEFSSITVETINLDDYFKRNNLYNKIDFIKIDVEGAEFFALQGMKQILESSVNVKIFIEFVKIAIEDSGMDPKKMLDFLFSLGFKIYLVDEQTSGIRPIDVNELLTSEVFHNRTLNLLCKRQ